MKRYKLWKKQEKRIVKLLYQKGLLNDFKIAELYWAEYKKYKRDKRKNKAGYRFTKYLPEIHFCIVDYWGEADEFSIVDAIIDQLYWDNAKKDPEDCYGEWPDSYFNYKDRLWFIKYLQKLPTVRNDSKINKLLICEVY